MTLSLLTSLAAPLAAGIGAAGIGMIPALLVRALIPMGDGKDES